MANHSKDVFVLGKNNQKVSVNVPDFLFSTIEAILGLARAPCLRLQGNKYLFGEVGTTDRYRDSRHFFNKQIQVLNLKHVQRKLGSQGLRRDVVSKSLVSTKKV